MRALISNSKRARSASGSLSCCRPRVVVRAVRSPIGHHDIQIVLPGISDGRAPSAEPIGRRAVFELARAAWIGPRALPQRWLWRRTRWASAAAGDSQRSRATGRQGRRQWPERETCSERMLPVSIEGAAECGDGVSQGPILTRVAAAVEGMGGQRNEKAGADRQVSAPALNRSQSPGSQAARRRQP